MTSVKDLGRSVLAALPELVIAILILVITWMFTRLIDRMLSPVIQRIKLRDSLIELFRKFANLIVWITGILIAGIIVVPGFSASSVLAALGLGSVAIGFAFKDIFENFLAGILILMREPFRLGDVIECNGYEGVVEKITIRDTHIRMGDTQRVVMPNATLFKEPVIVRTDLPHRRVSVICGIAYEVDIDVARRVILAAISDLPSIIKEMPIRVIAKEFGDSSVNLEIGWSAGSGPLDVLLSKDEIITAVKRALDDAGIEIPFPQRVITLKKVEAGG